MNKQERDRLEDEEWVDATREALSNAMSCLITAQRELDAKGAVTDEVCEAMDAAVFELTGKK